jgi:hypothetical protein
MPNDGAPFPTRNLRSLRELQLLMLDMEAVNLADLFVFLKTCRCPNLERIFVQVNQHLWCVFSNFLCFIVIVLSFFFFNFIYI